MKSVFSGSIFKRLLLLTIVLGIVPVSLLALLLALPLNLSISELRHILGILIMALPVASLCLAVMATRTIRKPMQELLMTQRQFHSGHLNKRIPLEGDQDAVNLCRGFNVMAALVEESISREVREQRERALAKQASYIAHDMRSPLSVLKTYAELPNPDVNDPDVEDLRKSAERSVGKLEHMAEDLVNYAKASKLEKAQHHLSGIIYEGSIAEAKKKAEECGVKISCAMQGGILVNVDAYKLERVITNLINNAVQSIENGNGEVSIAATTEHNGVLKITVRDNGKGIDPEALPHIFDSFFTKGKKGGSGLGLAYCKQVIEAHGGMIDVASEIGKGTTFTIKIPNCAVEHAADCHRERMGTDLEETCPRSEAISPVILSTNVLIADDDPDIRQQWHKIIPEHGGTIVHTAKTVKEVEEATLDYSKIDTAIVDYQFYGEDKTGIDLIKYLKAKGVKTVYLCTGFYDNEVIINQAHAAGVDRILPKPIDPTMLA